VSAASRHAEPGVRLLIISIFVLLAVFVVLPLGMVLATGFRRGDAWTFALFNDVFTSRAVRAPLWNSIRLGATVAVTGTVLGYIAAYVLTMISLPLRRSFRLIATLPMIAPPFMFALATIMLLGRNGVITNNILIPLFGTAHVPDIYGFWGLVLVQTLTYFPTAMLLLIAVFGALDPVLEEAAQSQGASPFTVFRKIVLPLSMPGILSALLLLFIESLADFGNPLILGGDFQVLSVAAFLKITGEFDTGGGAVLATLLLLPAVIAFLAQRAIVRRTSFATILGRPSTARRPRSTLKTRAAAFAIAALIAAFVGVFFGAVVYASFVEVWGVAGRFTMNNYTGGLAATREVLADSIILATIATPITGLFGVAAAWVMVRRRFPGRRIMEVVAMSTFAVPGTVVGIGYVLAFNRPPILLTGTAAIIILLFVFRNVPIAIEAGMTAIRQIDTSIEESAASLGADPATAFRRVVLPLIAPAFFTGLAHSFVRCMTAISAVVFVVSGEWKLLTVSILGFVENSDLSRASALCMILVAIVSAVLAVAQVTVGRRKTS
jgi:iron(III) transport system permease protein